MGNNERETTILPYIDTENDVVEIMIIDISGGEYFEEEFEMDAVKRMSEDEYRKRILAEFTVTRDEYNEKGEKALVNAYLLRLFWQKKKFQWLRIYFDYQFKRRY